VKALREFWDGMTWMERLFTLHTIVSQTVLIVIGPQWWLFIIFLTGNGYWFYYYKKHQRNGPFIMNCYWIMLNVYGLLHWS
jgi:hypothetical protein